MESEKKSALTVPVSRNTFDEVMVPVFAPSNMIPVRGAGLNVWDQSGRRYLDFTAGIAVTALGHSNPELVEVIQEQARTLWHVSNIYTNEPVLRLALAMTKATFADRAFFCNSGAEANEAAFKLARRYAGIHFGNKKTRIISCLKSFHGRTLFTVSVGGQPKYSADFAPLPPNIDHIPFNDIEAARKAIGDDVCAVVVEPVQGEGGVLPATKEYLQALRDICNEKGALLIFDEIQSGMGRTGHLFAYMDYGISPDIMTCAKALGNGFPIAAMLATDKVAQAFSVGTHGTTFGGNPLAASVALKVFDTINNEAFLARVRQASEKMFAMLNGLVSDFPDVFSAVRGKGLLIGLIMSEKYNGKAKDFTVAAEEAGLMLLVAGTDIVRIAPALIVSDSEIAEAENLMRKAVKNFIGK